MMIVEALKKVASWCSCYSEIRADPVENLPEEVSEIIFGYLRGNELLKVSLVSQSWKSFIGSSPACMKKLSLVMKGKARRFTSEDKEALLTSGRQYQNVYISDGTEVVSFIIDVLNTSRSWKSVKVFGTKFPSSAAVVSFLKAFEPTVEHLELTKLQFDDSDEVETDFAWKRLKFLAFWCSENFGLVKECRSLSSLILFHPQDNWNESTLIIDLLNQQEDLICLGLSSEWARVILSANFEEFPFRLENLTVTISLHKKPSDDEKLLRFLKSQASSIKTLDLGDWFGIDVLKFAFELRMLKKLRLSYIPTFDWKTVKLAKSLSVEHLDLSLAFVYSDMGLVPILKSLPNVKILYLLTVEKLDAHLIAYLLRRVQKIRLHFTHRKSIEQILPNIEWRTWDWLPNGLWIDFIYYFLSTGGIMN